MLYDDYVYTYLLSQQVGLVTSSQTLHNLPVIILETNRDEIWQLFLYESDNFVFNQLSIPTVKANIVFPANVGIIIVLTWQCSPLDAILKYDTVVTRA